jgi:hypothetical protein
MERSINRRQDWKRNKDKDGKIKRKRTERWSDRENDKKTEKEKEQRKKVRRKNKVTRTGEKKRRTEEKTE